MSNQSADEVLDALGEPVRRRILELLKDGPTPVGRLAEQLPVGRPAVSKHLRILGSAGLIEHRSVGTRNLYSLAPDGLAGLQQWLVGTWDVALSAFAAEVARVRQPTVEPGGTAASSAGTNEPTHSSRRRTA